MALGYFAIQNWRIIGIDIDVLSINVDKQRKFVVKKQEIQSFIFCCPMFLDENGIFDENREIHQIFIKILGIDGQFMSGSFVISSANDPTHSIALSTRKRQDAFTLSFTMSWYPLLNTAEYGRLQSAPKVGATFLD